MFFKRCCPHPSWHLYGQQWRTGLAIKRHVYLLRHYQFKGLSARRAAEGISLLPLVAKCCHMQLNRFPCPFEFLLWKNICRWSWTKATYGFGSVRFKWTRVPFLGQSGSFGGKALPDPGVDQTAKNVDLTFPLPVNPGARCFQCEG